MYVRSLKGRGREQGGEGENKGGVRRTYWIARVWRVRLLFSPKARWQTSQTKGFSLLTTHLTCFFKSATSAKTSVKLFRFLHLYLSIVFLWIVASCTYGRRSCCSGCSSAGLSFLESVCGARRAAAECGRGWRMGAGAVAAAAWHGAIHRHR